MIPLEAPEQLRLQTLLSKAPAGYRQPVAEEHIQSLWSGYGQLRRLEFASGRRAVLKEVSPPVQQNHPRGWSGARGHRRKLRSYEIELGFYRGFASRSGARVPKLLSHLAPEGSWSFLLEDLDAEGFSARRSRLEESELIACVHWLADFHAGFVNTKPNGLWPVGTYWHLETRPDELEAMSAGPLREAAQAIDARLSGATYQTLVHGDAKFANFCFTRSSPSAVAAVDFQYIGGGCGMKDIAYLFSCMDNATCSKRADSALTAYFTRLRTRLPATVDADALETEWRDLYPLAWADFMRFLAGWAPGHPKQNGYASRMTAAAFASL